ncbi:MAG: ABC transporter ATP-binding protein [Candidatus Dormibacter sp.]|uniref:ABC transporter ATP-binding protein n=1 Tax=Candidatus Dormibacter sp. TaxID=2973982 RepID=UPI000DB5833F|nr:MAG: peptide ABC transporter ATP-binding protein [Candidatus Dormibacteraeota bacterium]
MTALLAVEGLSVTFPSPHGGKLTAVDGVDLLLQAGEVVGLIGESGCGKSTLARTIVRLHQPSAGRILFEGQDVGALGGRDLRAYRKRVQYIFQDPYSSLNPRYSVRQTLVEALTVAGLHRGAAQVSRTEELVGLVGLPLSSLDTLPSALSGGQRQRVAIARALALEPRVLICDEPVSALDVSIRAQIMNLLLQLQRDFNLAYLFIGHDLPLVRRIADRIAVMYLGAVVEEAPSDRLFEAASHPYTRALIAATPTADPELERTRSRVLLSGELPRATDIPSGCRFHPRCPEAFERCPVEIPKRTLVEQGHVSYCHLSEESRVEGGLRVG